MIRRTILPPEIDHKTAVKKYIKAANKGIVKVMSKMGISTIQSYRGAQIFEAVGLNFEFIDKYFTWTATRIQGIGLTEVAAESEKRHRGAFPERPSRELDLDWGGRYQWRRDGEKHLFNPDTIHKLQTSVRTSNYKLFKAYSADVNEQSKALATLRGLFKFKKGNPVPLDQVEPASEIVKRFVTGAMSYGSISQGSAPDTGYCHEPHRAESPTRARAVRMPTVIYRKLTVTPEIRPSSRWLRAASG